MDFERRVRRIHRQCLHQQQQQHLVRLHHRSFPSWILSWMKFETGLLQRRPISNSFAIRWPHGDPMTMSTPNRSSQTVLERYVLMVLYFSTSGPRWNIQFWNISESVCNWKEDLPSLFLTAPRGVECEDGILTTLALVNNNLVGTIPWELGLLSNLTYVMLQQNTLTLDVFPICNGASLEWEFVVRCQERYHRAGERQCLLWKI